MKLQLLKPSAAAVVGLLLTTPTTYFILIAILKYMFGWPALFDASEPVLNALGANKPLGWNINLLLVFGPTIAFVLNLSSILQWNHDEEGLHLHFSFRQKTLNWAMFAVSGGVLAVLFLYALGENCRC